MLVMSARPSAPQLSETELRYASSMKTPLAAIAPILLLAGCSTDPLVGAWQSRVSATEGYVSTLKDLEFSYVFNQGGTMTESSNYDGAPPVPPAYGIWRSLGSGLYETKYLFYATQPPEKLEQLPQGWGPAGHGEIVEQIRLAPNRNSFESTMTLKLFDPSGKVVPGGGTAKGHGTRIEF